MRYPNGKTYQKKESDNKTEKTHRTLLSAANRGMSLEEDINLSNDYYCDMGIALINTTVSLTSQRHPEKLPEVTSTIRVNPGFIAATIERTQESFFNTL